MWQHCIHKISLLSVRLLSSLLPFYNTKNWVNLHGASSHHHHLQLKRTQAKECVLCCCCRTKKRYMRHATIIIYIILIINMNFCGWSLYYVYIQQPNQTTHHHRQKIYYLFIKKNCNPCGGDMPSVCVCEYYVYIHTWSIIISHHIT